MTTALLLLASFAAIIGGALLFTNAVEWAGKRLGLGKGSVGSILAAVATALPESAIPVVALVGGAAASQDVAVGAIVGAPFMLATVAMAMVGLAAIVFAGRREQGRSLEPDRPTLKRDLSFFGCFFTAALLLGIGSPPGWLRYTAAGLLVASYAFYVQRTVRDGGEEEAAHELRPLYFDLSRHDPPHSVAIAAQLLLALGAIVGGAHLFVEELVGLAEAAGVSALFLALVLAPLATELPEKANSVLWIRQGKDELAIGNITGAMVFQSALPVSIGLVFTDWALEAVAVLAVCLGLAGAGLAAWALLWRRCFTVKSIAAWGTLFVTLVAFVLVAS
jgi:cation:H+ antiporter